MLKQKWSSDRQRDEIMKRLLQTISVGIERREITISDPKNLYIFKWWNHTHTQRESEGEPDRHWHHLFESTFPICMSQLQINTRIGKYSHFNGIKKPPSIATAHNAALLCCIHYGFGFNSILFRTNTILFRFLGMYRYPLWLWFITRVNRIMCFVVGVCINIFFVILIRPKHRKINKEHNESDRKILGQ